MIVKEVNFKAVIFMAVYPVNSSAMNCLLVPKAMRYEVIFLSFSLPPVSIIFCTCERIYTCGHVFVVVTFQANCD